MRGVIGCIDGTYCDVDDQAAPENNAFVFMIPTHIRKDVQGVYVEAG